MNAFIRKALVVVISLLASFGFYVLTGDGSEALLLLIMLIYAEMRLK